MADKDTREDDGTHGESPLAPDVPPSEGGPAPREPQTAFEPKAPGADPQFPDDAEAAAGDVAETHSVASVTEEPAADPHTGLPSDPDAVRRPGSPMDDTPDVPADAGCDVIVGGAPPESDLALPVGEPPVADPDPVSAFEIEAASGPEDATSAGLPEPAPRLEAQAGAPADSPDVHPADAVAEPDKSFSGDTPETDTWRRAIADAPVDPPESASPSVPADDPEPDSSPAETIAAADVAPTLSIDPPLAPSEPSFTSAAEDLFRPPAIAEEPHLITLGRRLNPTLRTPWPEVPDIGPRADLPTEPGSAGRLKPLADAWSRWKDASWPDRLRTAARYAAYAAGGYLALVLVLILLFRFLNPPGSMLMLTQLLTGTAINRTWVPLPSISPHLVRAVIVSEDGRFCEHSGIDTEAIREAIDRAARGTPRGASTISMQVTKNLFLWNAKSYVRKIIEIPLTLFMELVWPKWRILEVYLNIAEWAPGVFGAEAAARHHFHKPASRLSAREAALLAAVLPNPVVRDAGSPGPRTSAKARVVQSRVKAYGAVASCVVSHAGSLPAAPAAVRSRPVRKAPPKPAAPRKKQEDGWTPTLKFGPL